MGKAKKQVKKLKKQVAALNAEVVYLTACVYAVKDQLAQQDIPILLPSRLPLTSPESLGAETE